MEDKTRQRLIGLVLTGTTLGRWFQKEFAPVTVQEVRLNTLEATEGPTIHDIELFER